MPSDRNRMSRAGDYVLGLMDEAERERAEHDLEIDPAFRDAVLKLAERIHAFDRFEPPPGQPDEEWRQIAQRLAGLPQMHAGRPQETQQEQSASRAKPVIGASPQPIGIGLHTTGGRRGLFIVFALAAAFALGFLVGRL